MADDLKPASREDAAEALASELRDLIEARDTLRIAAKQAEAAEGTFAMTLSGYLATTKGGAVPLVVTIKPRPNRAYAPKSYLVTYTGGNGFTIEPVEIVK